MAKNNTTTVQILDLSYLYEVSGNEPQYILDIIGIYTDTMGNGLEKLQQLMLAADGEAISKQAHFLKSSAGIVSAGTMHPDLHTIELQAKTGDIATLQPILDRILEQYRAAQVELQAERPEAGTHANQQCLTRQSQKE